MDQAALLDLTARVGGDAYDLDVFILQSTIYAVGKPFDFRIEQIDLLRETAGRTIKASLAARDGSRQDDRS